MTRAGARAGEKRARGPRSYTSGPRKPRLPARPLVPEPEAEPIEDLHST